MGAIADDTETSKARTAAQLLSPGRRLDAIADILVRGLARVLLAQDAARREALTVGRGEPSAAKGGRTR
jgi:hypothetical protein